jgi:hypothetical protein
MFNEESALQSKISNELTLLERSILQKYFERYQGYSFPPPSKITVGLRKHTGAGRLAYLSHNGEISSPDGQLNLGRFGQINMDNLEYGASFWIYVKQGKLTCLEIVVNGDGAWDGTETNWKICDPETGEF